MYFLLEKVDFQPAKLVYWRVKSLDVKTSGGSWLVIVGQLVRELSLLSSEARRKAWKKTTAGASSSRNICIMYTT